MHRRLVVLFVVSAVLFPEVANAQPFDPRLSVRLGFNQTTSIFYPEVELENRLYAFEKVKVTLDGSVFAGYWELGGVKRFRCKERSEFCLQNFVTGARLRVTPERLFVPVSFFAELTYHVRDEKDDRARSPVDRRYGHTGAGAGVRLDVPLVWGVRFVAQWQGRLPITERDLLVRDVYGFGMSVPL